MPRSSLLRFRGPRFWPAWPALLAVMGVALFITLAQNGSFFSVVLTSTEGDPHRFGILASMFLLVLTATTALLVPAIGARSFKAIASLALVVSAAAAYFMSRYGIVVDTSMIRNVAETDLREASPLLTASALFHVFAYGIVPAVVVWLLPLRRLGVRRELGLRFSALGTLVMLCAGTVYLNYGPVTFFGHEHHALRMQINPAYPIYSLVHYAFRADGKPPPEREPLAATRVLAPTPPAKPTLFVFVMGETARADRFSLNGYARDTNAFTSEYDIVNFPQVTSCGTSTAESLPCLFSKLDQDDFSHAAFARNETLVQLLGRLGVATLWRDNSTGCKYICEPDRYESLAGAADPDFCRDDICVDEILLKDFDAVLADASRDRFIVLHQRGSHGPVYFTDTPDWAKVYLPECNLADLRTCDAEAINNAYDNTIRYTDFFLAQVIERLEQESDRYATAMLYVSDHGESLGEKGLYLHGLPYAIAPTEQTEVPMLFWASRDFYRTQQIDEACLRSGAASALSHDAIFHSILPVFDIQAADYDPELDIFAACRQIPALPGEMSSARI